MANTTGGERIEVLTEVAGRLWTPAVGDEAQALLDRLPYRTEEKRRARDEALDVLARCAPPRAATPRNETGLVVGYVQSGKTLSFTLLSALARDNGYRVVIVVTGTSKPLFRQSTDRLADDLQLNSRADQRWMAFTNPRVRTDRQSIEAVLRDWRDPIVQEHEKRCVLVTVMKNHRHLDNLIGLFTGLDLTAVPALIVDDEADQASLNTQVRSQNESSTYRRLTQLRRLFPTHSYLQYTATPQAPLLINVIDVLSPNFAEMLTPGADYVGGRDLFLAPGQPLVQVIPTAQIPGPGNVLNQPPDILLEAMASFVIGVSAFMTGDRGTARNRSMMVHPSRETAGHADYRLWVESIRENWARLLELPESDQDRQELIDEELRVAHANLQRTAPDLPSFDQLAPHLSRALRQIIITEVNTRRNNATQGGTPQINWRRDPFHILVGGQALDRGFTVEGLTVTYMPRGLGVGNADTVQQRARFFGYKRSYLGYCRVYVGPDVHRAFVSYVRHEEDMRKRLQAHRDAGQPLAAWKRAFFLDPQLRPTRDEVLDLPYIRGDFSDDWFTPAAPHKSADGVVSNRRLVQEFLTHFELRPDQGHPSRTAAQIHLVGSISLAEAYENLLTSVAGHTNPEESETTAGRRVSAARGAARGLLVQGRLAVLAAASSVASLVAPGFGVDVDDVAVLCEAVDQGAEARGIVKH